jgi:hypothetical protein
MALEIAIRSLLVADSPVNTLVSGRVYPYMKQQGAEFPSLIYTLDSTQPQQGIGGHLDLTRTQLTVFSVATSYTVAKDLAAKVRTALNGYSGTEESVVIKSLVHDNDTASIEDSQVAGDRGVSIIESEFIIWYETG